MSEEGTCCVCGRIASACKGIVDPTAYPDEGEWFCSRACNDAYHEAEGDYEKAKGILRSKPDPDEEIKRLHRENEGLRKSENAFRVVGAGAMMAVSDQNDDLDRLRVQLAGCLTAAEGWMGDCDEGDYGWSPAFAAVRKLRLEVNQLRSEWDKAHEEVLQIDRKIRERDEQLQKWWRDWLQDFLYAVEGLRGEEEEWDEDLDDPTGAVRRIESVLLPKINAALRGERAPGKKP